MPKYKWTDRPLETWLEKPGQTADRVEQKLIPLVSRPGKLPPNIPWNKQTAVEEADRILNGEIKYFAHEFVKTGLPPDWHKDYFSKLELPSSATIDSTNHWSQLSDDSTSDIKFIWEPNRFAFVYSLVRAYTANQDEKYPEAFWALMEDWAEKNPPNTGPNWMDGQGAVASEMLGPPRLTKLLYEAHVLSLLRPSVRALADSASEDLAREAHALLQGDHLLRQQIVSVGLPIVTPDGNGIYRGRVVVVPPDPAEPLAAAGRGWVDLRPNQFAVWVRRAGDMVRAAEARSTDPGSGSADWTAIDADEPIEPSRFATWVFRFEDLGERIKR